MYKEMIISVIIVFVIIIGDFFMQNYAKKSIDLLTEECQKIRESLEKKDEEESIKLAENTKQKWEEKYTKMAYYIEHNELEKVSQGFITFMSYINLENYDLAINRVDETIFSLEHIAEKYQLNLENIF